MSLDAYNAFKSAITATSMPASLKIVGYDQQELLALCERVTAYNGGAKAIICGTAVAVSNILPNGADAFRINTESSNIQMKLIKNFYDYDVMVMPQVATGDFTDFGMAMDDNELYIISPSADKPIKGNMLQQVA